MTNEFGDMPPTEPEILTGTTPDFENLTDEEKHIVLMSRSATARSILEEMTQGGQATDEEIMEAKERKTAADQKLVDFQREQGILSPSPEEND
jgi:capsule polysaccharide export protein KpsE/RkpR